MEQRPGQWDSSGLSLRQQGAADDRGLGARGGERPDVGGGADAARGQDARAGRYGGGDEVEVRALRASRRDRSPSRGRAARRRARAQPREGESRRLGPACGTHVPVAHVEGERRARRRARATASDPATPPCRRRRGRRPPRAARARRRGCGSRPRPERGRRRSPATRRTSSGRTRPERAPSRSTRWIRAAPAAAQRRASAIGSLGPRDDGVVVALVQAHGLLAEHVDGRNHLDRSVEPHVMPC